MAQAGPIDDAMLRDPYEVLGVDRGASSQEIKSACEYLTPSSLQDMLWEPLLSIMKSLSALCRILCKWVCLANQLLLD